MGLLQSVTMSEKSLEIKFHFSRGLTLNTLPKTIVCTTPKMGSFNHGRRNSKMERKTSYLKPKSYLTSDEVIKYINPQNLVGVVG